MSTNQHQLGHYELVQQLMSSTPGERWKAFDTEQRYYVILSLLPLYPQANLTRYVQEMAILQSLRHPNIAPVLDIQPLPQQNRVMAVTDYIDGPTLAESLQALARTGKLFEIADLPFLLAPIASAIDYAHQHGIIHNALSPSNILLDRLSPLNNLPGTPLLIGFCNSYLYPTQDIPRESVPYVSPELAQGHMENARSDIYSLGVILYELCTGTLPFHGDTTADITAQHVHSTPISPALINPNLPPALTAVIMRALSRDPLARFPTATSLVVAVARALNMPAHDILDQISSSPGSPSSTPWQDSMHSPTYLSFPQMTPARVAALTPQQPGFTPQPSYTTVQARAPVPTTPPPPTLELQHAPPIPQAPGQRPAYKRKRSQLLVALLILVALLGASLGGFLLLRNTFTAAPAVVGHAFFASSGQINLNTDVGIADQLRINLDGLPDPPTGQSYFFWLLSENNAEKLPVSLGQSTHGGHIDITYDKNSRHENLLANYSRLLVTLENIDPTPTNPATDTASWRYYAEFSTQKTGQFSQLDHLRHLLAKDPKLQQLSTPLNGGLDIWLFRNTLKVLEFAGSARDAQASGDIGLVQRQLVRILDYLDGAQYVQTEKLPAGLPYMLIDPVIAQVALLEIDEQHQSPPGYLKHISNHLGELSHLPTSTPDQRKLASQINQGLNNVQRWMLQLHADAAALAQLSPDQLRQPDARAKLNDLFTMANYSFTGHFDPDTGQIQEGVSQIHYNNLRLATFDVAACSSGLPNNPCM